MKFMYVPLLGVLFITSCNKPEKSVLSDTTANTSKTTASFVPLYSVYEPQVQSCGCDHDTASCGQAGNSVVLKNSNCANKELVSAKCGSEDAHQKTVQVKK